MPEYSIGSHRAPGHLRRLRKRAAGMLKFSIVLPLFLTIMFPLVYGFSMHSPQPHHLKVAVVGDSAQSRALAMRMDAQAGDSFEVSSVPTPQEAQREILDLDVRAAWDPESNTVWVASMGSTSATQFAKAYFMKAAPQVLAQTGKHAEASAPEVRDLVPPPDNDGLGMSLMFMGLPALMAGYMLAMGLRGNLARLSARVALPIMAVAALFFATVPMFIAYSVYGAFSTAALPVYVLMAFASFTFMLFHTGGMRLIGLYMALPTMLVLVLLGIPSSGAGMATELVPPALAAFHHWLPTPALLDALRRLIYFPGASVAGDVMTLMLWFFLACILLLASFLRRPRPQDADAAEAEQEGAGPVRGRHRARGAAPSGVSPLGREGFLETFGTRRVVSEQQMSRRRGLVHAFKLPLLFVLAMPLMYIGVMHHPSPHHMRIDVVATDAASRHTAEQLDQLPESDYDVRTVDSVDAAREDILHNRARAAYVPASVAREAVQTMPEEKISAGSPVALVASGNGLQSQQAVTKLFTSLAAGKAPQSVDLAPTGENDKFGMSLIYLGMGGIVGSNIAGMMIGLAGRGWSWTRRVRWILGVAAANTLAQYVISVWVVQFLDPGVTWTVWPILFLMSVSIQFFATGGALLIKNSVNLFSIGIFMFIGVPASGLFLPLDLAPPVYTWLHRVVPSSAALGAIRTQVYLPQAPIASSVVLELVWLLVGIGVYAWGAAHVARARRTDAQQAEAEESQYDHVQAGEFETAVLTGAPGPETRRMQTVRDRRKEEGAGPGPRRRP